MIRSILAACALALVPASAFAQDLPRRATLGASAAPAENGVQIAQVRPGSPAAQAGLATGDVVTRVGGEPVATPQAFVAAVRTARAGRVTTFDIERQGQTLALPVTLLEAPRETAADLTISYEAIEVDGALRRTLIAQPRGPRQRRPAMLIVGGIGCYSIDDANAPDPYRTLAHDLARRGIVVMRLEKSGVGDSQGPACATVDFETEVRSYDAALTALRADRRVDASQVFVFGHSIGTVSAPYLAKRRGAAGVIAAQGLGRTWFEYEMINTRRQIELSGASPAETDTAMIAKAECMSRALLAREPVAQLFAERPDCAQFVLLPASQAYMSQLTRWNVAENWLNLTAPTLVIYGDSDFLTDLPDHQRIVDIVNGAHPGNATLAVIEGMDHFMVRSESQASSMARAEAGQALAAYDERFSTTIGDWICARARCTGSQSAGR